MANFRHTIHQINAQHYSQKQRDAWAPTHIDNTLWNKKIAHLSSFVCVEENKILGYSDIQKNGYINHFFCHHQHQCQGVGSALIKHIHSLAKQQGTTQLSADVSITAKPFFEIKGFKVVKKQAVPIRGQIFVNFKMTKTL